MSLRLARVSVFSALSVVGSLIHLPSPVQTVAFDSAPGFFVALMFGPLEGAVVTGVGHVITSSVNGFPLGLLHLPIALGLGAAGCAIGFLNRKFGPTLGLAVGVGINTALVILAVPVLGWAPTIAFAPLLAVASFANAAVAGASYVAVRGRMGR